MGAGTQLAPACCGNALLYIVMDSFPLYRISLQLLVWASFHPVSSSQLPLVQQGSLWGWSAVRLHLGPTLGC